MPLSATATACASRVRCESSRGIEELVKAYNVVARVRESLPPPGRFGSAKGEGGNESALPPAELRVFSRLLNLKGEDAFLLEAIFRAEAWGLISEPVSETNEREACQTMISGCEAALAAYPSRVDEDRAVAEDAAATPRARLAARVVMGEKQALAEAMGYFAAIERRLDQMEYYQERRLRSLNLLDRDGNSTYDPFEDTMA